MTIPDSAIRVAIPVPVQTGETFEQYINIDLMEQQVIAALGERIDSVAALHSGLDYAVGVGFVSPFTPAERAQVEALVAGHDPQGLTGAQQETADRLKDFRNLFGSVGDILAQGDAGKVAIDADLALLQSNPTQANAIAVLRNTLNRQRKIIEFLELMVRALSWLVKKLINGA